MPILLILGEVECKHLDSVKKIDQFSLMVYDAMRLKKKNNSFFFLFAFFCNYRNW